MQGELLENISPQKILGLLDDFESFCMGKKRLSPEEVRTLNEELSIGALTYVGKFRYQVIDSEEHLIWSAPDKSSHDLGPVDKLNVMRDGPGFHRTRSLALGHDDVASSEQVDIPALKTHVSIVKMKDGSTGCGPNYRVALRNAALRMHLKKAFKKANPTGIWKLFYGNA